MPHKPTRRPPLTKRERAAVAVMAVATVLFALTQILPWKSWIVAEPDVLNALDMCVTRFLGGVVFLGVITYLEYPVLRLSSAHARHTALQILPFFVVALNNFPFLSVLSGDAYVSFPIARTALLAAEYLAVALFEESAFRGVLLTALLNRWNRKPGCRFCALLVSSAVFGLTHLVNLLYGGSPASVLLQIGYSFLIGGMCGIAMLLCGNIWLSVALHALYDFCGAAVPFLGGGTIWTAPTVILTAVLGFLVFLYALLWLWRDTRRTPGALPRDPASPF